MPRRATAVRLLRGSGTISWRNVDKATSCSLVGLLILVASFNALIWAAPDPHDAVVHLLVLTGLPASIFIVSLKTINNKTAWWLPFGAPEQQYGYPQL